MGYYMEQRDQKFKIKAGNKPAALKAIKNLAGKEKELSKNCFGASAHYAWVDEVFISRNCIEDALTDWRWDAYVDPQTKDIISICFDGEKLGDEEALFDAIAPFVEEGSFIEMQGEDGNIWRWCFTDSKRVEKKAKISWD